MSQSQKSTILRQLGRWAILSAGLAIAVTGVLLGILRIRRDLPEWVYWKSELIFLITIEIAYGTAACLSVLGVIVLGTHILRARGRGQRRPSIARGLLLCI